jgi:hypothetical protein
MVLFCCVWGRSGLFNGGRVCGGLERRGTICISGRRLWGFPGDGDEGSVLMTGGGRWRPAAVYFVGFSPFAGRMESLGTVSLGFFGQGGGRRFGSLLFGKGRGQPLLRVEKIRLLGFSFSFPFFHNFSSPRKFFRLTKFVIFNCLLLTQFKK